MSANKETVRKYIDGFNKNDHAQILSCLTEDIEWTVFGYFHLVGKEAYDQAIDGPAFAGPPVLEIVRLVEEGDQVMAEIAGQVPRPDGGTTRMVMAEVFAMRDALICERRAFVIELKENEYK